MNNTFFLSKVCPLIIIIISSIIALSFNFDQRVIEAGLILSGKITYPDSISPFYLYIKNSWTLLNQISATLFILNFSEYFVSQFFILISTLMFGFGIYLTSLSLTKHGLLSLLITIYILILGKNFGDTDYPTLFYSLETYGMVSLSLSTLIFGLLFSGNFKLASFLTLLLVSVHPIIGLWMMGITTVVILFEFNKTELQTIRSAILFGLTIIGISFYFYYINADFQSSYSLQTFNNYIDYWDGHRANNQEIHYEYLFKTLLLVAFIILYYSKNTNIPKNIKIGLKVIFLSVIISLLFYFFFKFFYEITPSFFRQVLIPSRFLIQHSVIGWPLIISIIFLFFIKKNINLKNKVFLTISSLLIIHLLMQLNHISEKLNPSFVFEQKNKKEKNLNYALKDVQGYVLTNNSLTRFVLNDLKKPVLIDIGQLDFLPYHRYLSDKTKNIIEEIYQINFTEPPILNNPSIGDNVIHQNFTKIDKKKWKEISEQWNISLLILPQEIKIAINPSLTFNNLNFYYFN